MLPVLLLVGPLVAAVNGFYHPDDVAEASSLFGRAAAATGGAFEAAQADLDRASRALVALDRNAALLGSRAPDGFADYSLALRRDGARGLASVQSFVDALITAFEADFGAALQRALPGVAEGQPTVECRATMALPGGPVIPGRTHCPGRDLNAGLARAMDADPALQADVDRLLATPWPGFALSGVTQPVVPLTGVQAFLRMDAVVEALIAPRIAAIEAQDRAARTPLEADLEEGDETARGAAMEAAEALRVRYEAAMGALGGRLVDALAEALPRLEGQGAPEAVGLCPNPAALGGCPGQDVTDTVLPLLQADRRLGEALDPRQQPALRSPG
ncbi:MAG: hypothetical protein JXB39_10530 [Deltaproteobacteria bacterium]|nr:hypothetical protein [Deltaproteobacteria bacterium]